MGRSWACLTFFLVEAAGPAPPIEGGSCCAATCERGWGRRGIKSEQGQGGGHKALESHAGRIMEPREGECGVVRSPRGGGGATYRSYPITYSLVPPSPIYGSRPVPPPCLPPSPPPLHLGVVHVGLENGAAADGAPPPLAQHTRLLRQVHGTVSGLRGGEGGAVGLERLLLAQHLGLLREIHR